MNLIDLITIALRNIKAGKEMVKKIVFGITVINMLIICFITIAVSYFGYKADFSQKHMSDCYYYLPIEEQSLSASVLEDILDKSEKLSKKYSAMNSIVLCNIESINNSIELNAKNTKIISDNNIHEAEYKHTFYSQATFYKNIDAKYSAIELVAFYRGMTIFPEYLKNSEKEFMVGEYPNFPGEIMIDDYLLSVYGFSEKPDELIGKTISFLTYDGESQEYVFKDYKLTGIFHGDILSKRENIYTSDLHIEHIYINLKENDMDRFHIIYGSIRCYFEDYSKYVNNYDYVASLLQLDIDHVLFNEGKIRLTAKGMAYCVMHFFMEHIGKLLIIIASIIGLIITFSILYIFKFYADRQKNYRIMLSYIGMEHRDRKRVSFIETFFIFLIASIISIYFSVIFLLILNYITKMLLDFSIIISVANCMIALLCSWLYFAICKKLTF